MTREKAIEAAAERNLRSRFSTIDDWHPNDQLHKMAEAMSVLRGPVEAAAPLIESALLDRIETAVRGLRDEETSEPDVGDRGTYGTIYGLDAVLTILTEIRQGLGPAQSPEAGK